MVAVNSMISAIGCSTHVEFTPDSPVWWGPYAADLGALSSSYVSDLGGGKSHGQYEMYSTSAFSILVGVFYNLSAYRVLGRTYRPEIGWAGGAEFDVLDANNGDVTSVSGGFLSTGDFIAAMTGGSISTTQSAVFSASSKLWSTAVTSIVGSTPVAEQPDHGRSSSTAVDPLTGNAYFAYLGALNGAVYATPYTATAGWSPAKTETVQSGTSASQVEVLFDGFNFVAVWRDGNGLQARVLGNSSEKIATLGTSGATLVSFAAASDSMGNVVVVFHQTQTPTPTCAAATSARPETKNCQYRLFASTRNAQGIWTGPTRIDEESTVETTTYYQDAATEGGLQWPNPSIAHLGSSRFLVSFAPTDNGNAKGTLRVRGYTAGSGWDPTSTEIETGSLKGSSVLYRFYNDTRIVSDGSSGNALLIAQEVTTNAETAKSRALGYVVFRYLASGSGWQKGTQLNSDTTSGLKSCPATVTNCADPRPTGTIFSTGEAVAVLPSICDKDIEDLCLYTFVYKKDPE